jgi:hypothetical protein
MTRYARPSGRRPRPHAQLHLPALSAEQALLLVRVLERTIEAVYRAHGDAMVELAAAGLEQPAPRTLRIRGSLPDDFPF